MARPISLVPGLLLFALLLFALAAFGQSNSGSITGAISDPANAAVPNAAIEVKNVETGTVYRGGTSATGNYVIPVPAGKYELSVTGAGFKKYIRQNLEVRGATDTRQDVALELGSLTDTVTVNEVAPLLKTESGELSHTVTGDQAANLPVLTLSGGNFAGATRMGNIRNPLAESQLIPGVAFANDQTLVVNGLPSNSETIRIEGQESSGTIWKVYQQQTQGGVDAIQEVAIQTSNFAAEFGQAAGGYFNFTMKSGTNQLHGGAYDYLVNEALNAGLPFTDAATQSPLKAGQHIRNRVRRNDYGFTLGGPIVLPKVYRGRDRSFFFFNFEQYREAQTTSNDLRTFPTAAFRNGDFSLAGCQSFSAATQTCAFNPGNLTIGGVAAQDPAGQNLPYGGVFDPATTRLVNGVQVRSLFLNNRIPSDRLDPVALALQKLIPLPNNGGLLNNYNTPAFQNFQHTTNASFKIDHSISSTIKVSGYYSRIRTYSPAANGFPSDWSGITQTENVNNTVRLNYDQSIRPTLLLHVGIGYFHTHAPTLADSYDAASKLGLKGYYVNNFPTLGGLSPAIPFVGPTGPGFGGPGFGPGFVAELWEQKPTANTSLTWVKNNHTYKFGGEYTGEGYIDRSAWRANGSLQFSNSETSDPWQNGQPLNFANGTGTNYASFLLGLPDNLGIGLPTNTRLGNHYFALFAQDTWKVNRKLTLDYGLRYDFATYLKEQYGRMRDASPSTPNANAGGRPGALIYEGYGGGRCNCEFSHNYKLALGPRLGFAYQIDTKTVLRGGAGLQYGVVQTPAGVQYVSADYSQINASSYGVSPLQNTGGLAGGNPYAPGNPYGNTPLVWPNFDGSKFPVSNGGLRPPQSPDIYFDNQARPGRIFTYSLGLQRQVLKDLVLEASYVGNRGAWFAAPLLAEVSANAVSLDRLKTFGLDINNAADRSLLVLPIGSDAVKARFPNLANPNNVYPGFPSTQTLVQALRPVPQWPGAILTQLGPPKGTTWYDSVQIQATKRFSHGLQMQGSYVYAKGLVNGTSIDTTYFIAGSPIINDIYNRGLNKQLNQFVRPNALVISGSYITPGFGATSMRMKVVSQVLRDWQIGALLRYQSGALIQTPPSNNQLAAQLGRGGTATLFNRNPSQPLFRVDPNCGCFNPQKDQVLNPAAWTDAPAGTFGYTAPFSNDYRWQRQPAESMSFGRNFRMGRENRMNLFVRAEFQNIFNRLYLSSPATGGGNLPGLNGLRQDGTGVNVGGFGSVATVAGVGTQPRTGQIVARFQF